MESNASFMFKMGSKTMIGGTAGYLCGRFFKQISDIAIFYSGLALLFVAGLTWSNWISINWSVIDEDLLHIWVRAKNRAKDSGIVSRIFNSPIATPTGKKFSILSKFDLLCF